MTARIPAARPRCRSRPRWAAASATDTLAAFTASDRSNLIARTLVRYSDDWSSGINLAWAAGAPLMLALNSAGGTDAAHTATDARLKAQLEYWCDNANCPNGPGGYASQHQWAGAGATIIATKTAAPRVWNALSATNWARLETIMLAIAFGGAITCAANHPVAAIQNRKSLTGGTSGAAPNFLNGMLCPVLGLVAYYGSAAAALAKMTAFDIAAFRNQANGQGLTRIGTTYTLSGSGITDAQAQACVRNWTYFETTNNVTALDAHMNFLRTKNWVAANNGLNGGVGCRDAEIPNVLAENGKSCKLAVGRGKKYAAAAATTATRMHSEFATTNGVMAGISASEFQDVNKRSSLDYAAISIASLQALITTFALGGVWGSSAAFTNLLNDTTQGMIDFQAKGLGWHGVQNISLKQQWSDFDSTRHQEFMIAQRHAGWKIVSDFLRS